MTTWNNLLHPSSLPVVKTVLRDVADNIAAQVIIINDAAIFQSTFAIMDWNKASEVYTEWCTNHNVFYYARVKEEFVTEEAIALAIENNCPYLVLDDLS